MDPQAELLLLKASEDRAALAFDLPDAHFGFIAQQAFEKLFKALLTARNFRYARTHDLSALWTELELLHEDHFSPPYPFLKLQPFAVIFRYEIANSINITERDDIRRAIDELHEHVARRVKELAGAGP